MTISGRMPYRSALLALAVSLVWALPAQANVTLPGLNEKIGFSSFRDYPEPPGEKEPDRLGGDGPCGEADNPDTDPSCGEELYFMEADGSFENRLLPLNTRKDAKFSWSPLIGGLISFESRQNCEQYGEEELENRGCQADVYSVDGANVGPTQTRLTSHPGSDTHPTWSPAANMIAFESDRSASDSTSPIPLGEPSAVQQSRAIYLMPSSGEVNAAPATPLLPPAEDDGDPETFEFVSDLTPAWSPDGTQIAFTRLRFVVVQEDSSTDGIELLADLAADFGDGKLTEGGLRERLGKENGLGITFLGLSVQTYVAPAAGGGPATLVGGEEDFCALFEIDSTGNGADEAALCQIDRHPAWSPDGARLYIDRMAIDFRSITQGAGRNGTLPVEALLVLLFAGQDRDIWAIDVANQASQTNLSDATEDPDCVPVGTEILPPDTEGDPENPCHEEAKPAPSPDGTKVAFHTDRACPADSPDRNSSAGRLLNQPSRCFDIHAMNTDGSGVERLTDNPEADWNADWRRTLPSTTVTAAPPPPPAAPRTPAGPSVRVAGVRSRGCTASARMRVPIRVTAEAGVRRVQVYLDGRRIKTTSKSRFTVFVNARKLKSGRHRVTVRVTDRAGRTRRTTRRFSRCAQRPQRRAAPRFTG